MKSPIQARPIARRSTAAILQSSGVHQSDCCGAGKCCVGACIPILNECAGICVPNIGQC